MEHSGVIHHDLPRTLPAMSTLLCVPIMVHDVHAALADATASKEQGADLVEFRIDEFFGGDLEAPDNEAGSVASIVRLVKDSPLPCIVTCRHVSEGGHYDGDEDARVSLYERLGTATGRDEHPPRYLDFELDRYQASANIKQKINLAVDASGLHGGDDAGRRDRVPSLILSNHDFSGRPADFSRRALRMRDESQAVSKFAFRARSLRDNLELFDMLLERDRPTIALAMGEFGLMSRILAPKFGGFLTFASLRSTSTTAPGQPTVRELLDLYRFGSIKPSTKVYGVVGWPVGHSKSPLVHNAGFAAVGHDGVYIPLPIAANDSLESSAAANADDAYTSFKATMLALLDHTRLDLTGVSVTIPHKENLVRLAMEEGWELDEVSRSCGAANTLAVTRNGHGRITRARVSNTDAAAAVGCLEDVIGPVHGKTIGVLGAGGVSKAIVLALARGGANVRVHNRSEDRARELADAVVRVTSGHVSTAPWFTDDASNVRAEYEQPHEHADAWINCTPVGMKGGPAPESSPLPDRVLSNMKGSGAVLDTVYNPIRTPLLARAEELGLVTIDGGKMFVRQAAEQFHAWTGTNAPIEEFERLVRAAQG
jgi:3-dehydroquinate dehydratase/shikimate dehydrogenase